MKKINLNCHFKLELIKCQNIEILRDCVALSFWAHDAILWHSLVTTTILHCAPSLSSGTH